MSENTITIDAADASAVKPLIQLTDVSADAEATGCCGGGSCGV